MIIPSTQIDFSPIESNILGLKVGRCNSDNFDEKELYAQISKGNYDLCRLKVPAEDEMAPLRLDKTGLLHYFSGSIRRYKTKIKTPPEGSYNFDDLVFEMYDGSQDRLLRDMLMGTWGTYPIGYYRTPYLCSLLDKDKEIECVFQFYKKYNLNIDYPDNSILFIRHGDNYVGFFALNVVNNNLESHIGGILEPYRKSGYFLDKLRYIKEYCLSHGLEHFIFGARNENSEVQRIFQHVGFQAVGSDNVFHIPSLLTYSSTGPIEKDIAFPSAHTGDIYGQLFVEASAIAKDLFPEQKGVSFQLNDPDGQMSGKNVRLKFSFPVMTESELLMVVRVTSPDAWQLTGYFRAYR